MVGGISLACDKEVHVVPDKVQEILVAKLLIKGFPSKQTELLFEESTLPNFLRTGSFLHGTL